MAHRRESVCVNTFDAGPGRLRARTRAGSQARARYSLRVVLLLSGILAAIGPIRLASGSPAPTLPDYALQVGCTGQGVQTDPARATCMLTTADFTYFGDAVGFVSPPRVGVVVTTSGTGSEEASADLVYAFAVVGPPGNFVGVTIDSTLHTSGSGTAAASAQLTLDGDTLAEVCSFSLCADSSVAVHHVFFFGTGIVNFIEIDSFAFSEGGGAALSLVDPFLAIDPSTPNADQFTLVFSPGIVNTPPGGVPEPSILVLLITALVSLLVMRRASQAQQMFAGVLRH